MGSLRSGKNGIFFVGLVVLLGTLAISSVNQAQAQPVGRVVAWGSNNHGQCNVPTGDDFVDIAAGWGNSLALRADGSLVAWGYAGSGQLNVPAGNDFVAITSGRGHCAAIKSDGSLVAWGSNSLGQLDNIPVGNDFVDISAGGSHTLALRADGTIAGWGNNANSKINVPTENGFVAIQAGWQHSVALKADGTIVAWGTSEFNVNQAPPGSDFVGIFGGSESLAGWAMNGKGNITQWGYTGDSDRLLDFPPDDDIVALSCGYQHATALKTDGSVLTWGSNWGGQLNSPEEFGFVKVICGNGHSLALTPEPATLSLLGIGAMALLRRRRRTK